MGYVYRYLIMAAVVFVVQTIMFFTNPTSFVEWRGKRVRNKWAQLGLIFLMSIIWPIMMGFTIYERIKDIFTKDEQKEECKRCGASLESHYVGPSRAEHTDPEEPYDGEYEPVYFKFCPNCDKNTHQ